MSDPIRGSCWHCGRELTSADYGRENSCGGCAKPTRVCRNCRHFSPGRPNDCFEPVAEPVLVKDRANFCEFFTPAFPASGGRPRAGAGELLQAAEDLFK